MPTTNDDSGAELVACGGCSREVPRGDGEGLVYCESCADAADDDDVVACDGCGRDCSREDGHECGDGSLYCESCADARFPRCDDCEDRARRGECSTRPGGGVICPSCYESSYFTCSSCDEVFCNDDYDSEGRCCSCAQSDDDDDGESEEWDDVGGSGVDRGTGAIRGYSDKTASRRLGKFGRPILGALPIPDVAVYAGLAPYVRKPERTGGLFGVELEVECGRHSDRHEKAEEVYRRIGPDFVSIKSDSSLNDGFEIVTAPASLEIHRERWRDALGTRIEGLRAWSTTTAGMHVHYSREGIGNFTLGKLLVFMNRTDNSAFLDRIAGRTANDYCRRWPHIRMRDAHPERARSDRYECINLTNAETIEFRMFRSTLKYSRMMANLEFCASVVAWARDAHPDRLHSAEYVAWVGATPKAYPALSAWLRQNGILPTPKARAAV